MNTLHFGVSLLSLLCPGDFGHTHAFSSSATVYTHFVGGSGHRHFLSLDPFICPKESRATGIQEKGKRKWRGRKTLHHPSFWIDSVSAVASIPRKTLLKALCIYFSLVPCDSGFGLSYGSVS